MTQNNNPTTNGVVYIVDDETDVLESLSWLIQSMNYQVHTFSDPLLFIERYQKSTHECLILDVRMPGMTGLEMQELLKKKRISIPIIFITGHGDVNAAVRAIKGGATEFITKPINNDHLLELIHHAVSQSVTTHQKEDEAKKLREKIATLTDRERDVFNILISGASTKTIAERLGISPHTAELHRGKVMKKLQAKGVAQLVRELLVYGVVEALPEDESN